MVEPWQRGTRYTPEFKAKAARRSDHTALMAAYVGEHRSCFGGRPDLAERKFEGSVLKRFHVADITYVRMADGSFVYATFATDVHAHRIVGWACATTMNTKEPSQAVKTEYYANQTALAASL